MNLINEINRNGYLIYRPENDKFINLIYETRDYLNEVGASFSSSFSLIDPQEVYKANLLGYYKAINQSLYLHKFLLSETISHLLQLFNINYPCLGPSYIRSDIYEEKKHAFDWHQDAASLMGSINMFTYWIPLYKCSEALGTISLVPGSHKYGLLDSIGRKESYEVDETKNGNQLAAINTESLDSINLVVNPGEVVIFHPLLLHKSFYPSTTHPTRLSVILRIDDMGDKKHRELGYKCGQYNVKAAPEYINYYNSFNYD
jgi:phytanoyl-CoA hydroxylase